MPLKFAEEDDEPGIPTLELEPPEPIDDPATVPARPARLKEKTNENRS